MTGSERAWSLGVARAAARVRRGQESVLIVSERSGRRLDLTKLPRRTASACTPDELVEQGFADLWRPDP